MGKPAVLVLDFGSTNIHANIIDIHTGASAVSEKVAHQTCFTAAGACELDPDEIWRESQNVLRIALAKLDKAYTLQAITFTYVGDSLLCADENGRPLSNFLMYLDARAKAEADYVAEALGPRHIQLTGEDCRSYSLAAKILWLQRHKPLITADTRYYWNIQQFINHRLGLAPLTDYSMAAREVLLDTAALRWAPELLSLLSITGDQLGQITWADAAIGEIDYYGDVPLGKSLPVVIGCHDCVSASLGLGLTKAGAPCVANVTGTYDHLTCLLDGHRNLRAEHPDSTAISYPGAWPGSTLCLYVNDLPGPLFRWLREELLGGMPDGTYYNQLALDGSGSLQLLPFLGCEKGVLAGLGYQHNRCDIMGAFFEAMVFEMKHRLEEMEAILKLGATHVRMGGGVAQTDAMVQLRADIFGLPVQRVSNIEVSSVGAAAIAAKSLGYFPTVADAAAQLAGISQVFTPRTKPMARYRNKYQEYQALCRSFA